MANTKVKAEQLEAAQTSITSVGTLTALQVDNININGNTITANSGALNLTPASGSAIVLDGTINVDAGVVTGATSITSTAFVGTTASFIKASSGASATSGTVLTVEDDDNTELSILGGSSSVLAINFGHSGDNDEGKITFNTTSGSEDLQIVSSKEITLDAAGVIKLDADGGELQFLDGGTAIGSIAAHTGSLIIGGGDVGIGFYQGANALVPYNGVSALRDSAIDLGMASSGRFKDLYLSGGITCTTLTPSGRLSFGEHIIGSTATGYLQLTSGSGKAWAMSQGGGGAPGTDRNAFGIHHWNGSAWSNPLTIDANGHAGITSTPPAWGAAYTALTVGSSGALWCSKSGTSLTAIADNTYFDGSNQIARNTQAGAQYYMNAGSHVWETFASVSAGATQTSSVPFLINASGQLIVSRTGTNTPYASGLITFRPTSAFNTQVFLNPSTSAQNHSLFYNSSGTLIGYIQSSNSGTEFNTTSDYRLKKNIKSLSNQIEEVKKLKPVEFDWTFEESSSVGFIAHELQEVFPHAVSGEKDGVGLDGEMFPQGVDYGRITPLLTAALQEAITRIETLESEVKTLKGE